MKKQNLKKTAVAGMIGLCLGIICFATSSNAAQKKETVAASGANDGMANLVISRNPSVGSGIFVNVSADGKQLITLSSGRRYSGTLSPGKHVLSVIGDPHVFGWPEKRQYCADTKPIGNLRRHTSWRTHSMRERFDWSSVKGWRPEINRVSFGWISS
jgi:hypothetical protein